MLRIDFRRARAETVAEGIPRGPRVDKKVVGCSQRAFLTYLTPGRLKILKLWVVPKSTCTIQALST